MSNLPSETTAGSNHPPSYEESLLGPIPPQEEKTDPEEHHPPQSTDQQEKNTSGQNNQQSVEQTPHTPPATAQTPPATAQTPPATIYIHRQQQTRYYYVPPSGNITYIDPNTQSVYYVNGQNQIVYDYEPISQTFSGHMAIACLTMVFCGIIFGLVALILACIQYLLYMGIAFV